MSFDRSVVAPPAFALAVYVIFVVSLMRESLWDGRLIRRAREVAQHEERQFCWEKRHVRWPHRTTRILSPLSSAESLRGGRGYVAAFAGASLPCRHGPKPNQTPSICSRGSMSWCSIASPHVRSV